MFRHFTWSLVILGCSWLGCGSAEAGFILTANAPGSQSSTVAGVTTENFNSFTRGNYTTLTTAVGTLTSPGMEIARANPAGGAGGSGNYFAIGAESGQLTATLTLFGPQSYFGFWWSAADGENQIDFLSAGKVVASFNSSTALGQLSSAYKGNPNTGQDPTEPFAYLNFIGTNGSTFDQVRFSNTYTSSGFESDNWSVRTQAVLPTYPGAVLSGGVASVPEPSSLALTAVGFLTLIGVFRRRRRKSHPADRIGGIEREITINRSDQQQGQVSLCLFSCSDLN